MKCTCIIAGINMSLDVNGVENWKHIFELSNDSNNDPV